LLPVRFTADDLKASAAAKADPTSVAEWIRSPIYFLLTFTGKKFQLGHYRLQVSFADEKRNATFGAARFS
jgi:hypothetical protein